jgi:hypothetical protein
MLNNRALVALVIGCVLFMPGWITGVAGTSWNNLLKKWLIAIMEMISALSICTTIATPNPHLPTKIGGIMVAIAFFIASMITAYRVWPRQAG